MIISSYHKKDMENRAASNVLETYFFRNYTHGKKDLNIENTLGCASKISAILNAVEFCCCMRRCSVFMPRMIRYAAFCSETENKVKHHTSSSQTLQHESVIICDKYILIR